VDELYEDMLRPLGNEHAISYYLHPNSVYIIIDHGSNVTWLWEGRNTRTRQKFAIAMKAESMQLISGQFFTTRQVDQGEEPAEFFACIEQVATNGINTESN
jgi:hypothetical protein